MKTKYSILLPFLFSLIIRGPLLTAQVPDTRIIDPNYVPTPQEKLLTQILIIHNSAYPWEHVNWPQSNVFTYFKSLKKYIDSIPRNNHYRTCIDQFKNSAQLKLLVNKSACILNSTQLLSDLEIICGQPHNTKAHFAAHFTTTQTLPGNLYTMLLLARPTNDLQLLKQRQETIRWFINHEQERTALKETLKIFNDHSANFFSIMAWDIVGGAGGGGLGGTALLTLPLLKKIKDVPIIQTSDMAYATIFSIGNFASTVVGAYLLALYGIHSLRTWKTHGEVEGPGGLTKKDSEYIMQRSGQYWDMQWFWKKANHPLLHVSLAAIGSLFTTAAIKRTGTQLIREILGHKFRWEMMSSIMQTLNAAQSVYNATKSLDHLRGMNDIEILFNFFEKTVPQSADLTELFKLAKSWTLNPKKGTSFLTGYANRAHMLLMKRKELIADMLVGLGALDSYIGISEKFIQNQTTKNIYCFADYIEGKTPTLNLKNVWNALLKPETAVASDAILGGTSPIRNYLLTGFNAGGKSTYSKAIALAALCAQTITIVPATSCQLTLFDTIETYLNITDDIQQGNSLFKQEVARAITLIRKVTPVDGKAPLALLIFDEMFNGTTPYEGISCAYSVAAHIARQTNVLSIIATHFKYLTQLSSKYNSVQNMQVRLVPEKTPDNSIRWVKTYKVEPGIANQHVALDMLQEEANNTALINEAKAVLADLEKNGLNPKAAG
jgi:hypothetical protein